MTACLERNTSSSLPAKTLAGSFLSAVSFDGSPVWSMIRNSFLHFKRSSGTHHCNRYPGESFRNPWVLIVDLLIGAWFKHNDSGANRMLIAFLGTVMFVLRYPHSRAEQCLRFSNHPAPHVCPCPPWDLEMARFSLSNGFVPVPRYAKKSFRTVCSSSTYIVARPRNSSFPWASKKPVLIFHSQVKVRSMRGSFEGAQPTYSTGVTTFFFLPWAGRVGDSLGFAQEEKKKGGRI